MKNARIDQVTKFRGTYNEGYFCINTVQPLDFAFKIGVKGSFFKKKCGRRGLGAISRRYLPKRTPNVSARFIRHLEVL